MAESNNTEETVEYENWTAYDEWLTSPSSDEPKAPGNYNIWRITKIEQKDGKIFVTRIKK